MSTKGKGVLTPEQRNIIDEYKEKIIHNCIALTSNFKITHDEKLFVIDTLISITKHHISCFDKRVVELERHELMLRALYLKYSCSYSYSSASANLFPLDGEVVI